MKSLVFLSFIILLCLSCTQQKNLHFNILESRVLHYKSMNKTSDPLSMIYNQGLYHMFYRKPDNYSKNFSGLICHLTSQNLINWSDQPEITLTENNCTYFGGFITDTENTSGLGNGIVAPIIAILVTEQKNYEIADNHSSMIYSTDNGVSWMTIQEKLAYPQTFLSYPQDINIVWHEPSLKWVMSLFVLNRIEFYSSPDLRSWNFESSVSSLFSVPDIILKRVCLFPHTDDIHWTLMADWKSDNHINSSGGTIYVTGIFDGHTYTSLSSELNWIDFGNNKYGSIVLTCPDERRLNLLWSNNPEKDSSVTIRLTIPTQMALENISGEPVLSFSLVHELKQFASRKIKLHSFVISNDLRNLTLLSQNKRPVEIELSFNIREMSKLNFPSRFGLIFWNDKGENIMAGYETSFMSFFADISGLKANNVDQVQRVTFNHTDSVMDLRVLFTPSFIKIFGADGKIVITEIYSSVKPLDNVSLFSENGTLNLVEGIIIPFDMK